VAGAELFGPFAEGPEVKAAIVEAGKEFGLRQVGSRAYPTNALDSGWIPCPLPAVYTSPALRPYREWLPANSYEAVGSLGGSFYSRDVEDYYLTPQELGYAHILKFDHDFVGREALEARAKGRHRRRVTLVWNGDDVARTLATVLTRPMGQQAKYIDLPVSQYATWMYDKVMNRRGEMAGFSMWPGYSWNDAVMVSLATVREEDSQPGTEVVVIWGEEGGGSRKPSVEPHVQTEIRATVAPAPFAEAARHYRASVARR
jgi:vanillate/3-O-methylgallate O-demethylase